jgi:hypothetical protein
LWQSHIKSLLVGSALLLSSCAAKQFAATPMAQPGDAALSCPELKQQISANRATAEEFARKDKQVEQGNVAKNVGGIVPGVGLLLVASTDLSNEEQVKVRAMIDRNEQLTYLAKRKGCMDDTPGS